MTPEGERLMRTLRRELIRWWTDAAALEAKGAKIPAGTLRRRMQGVSWHLTAIARAEGVSLDPLTTERDR